MRIGNGSVVSVFSIVPEKVLGSEMFVAGNDRAFEEIHDNGDEIEQSGG